VEIAIVTKKEIVKRISEDIGLTQLKTKDIVQRTLDAIIDTLVSEGRIELRNFGVFEVKRSGKTSPIGRRLRCRFRQRRTCGRGLGGGSEGVRRMRQGHGVETAAVL
jgi:nucleoid DNA-binding protein